QRFIGRDARQIAARDHELRLDDLREVAVLIAGAVAGAGVAVGADIFRRAANGAVDDRGRVAARQREQQDSRRARHRKLPSNSTPALVGDASGANANERGAFIARTPTTVSATPATAIAPPTA